MAKLKKKTENFDLNQLMKVFSTPTDEIWKYEQFVQITSQQSYTDLSFVTVSIQTDNSWNWPHPTPFISQYFLPSQLFTTIFCFQFQRQTAYIHNKSTRLHIYAGV